MRRLVGVGVVFLLFSCYVPSPFMSDTNPSETPASNEAKVVFYRTDTTGNASPFPVYADQQLVGYPERGRYFEVHCEPGEHVFSGGQASWAAWPSRGDAVVLAMLEPGKTYYIQAYASGAGCAGGVWGHLKPLRRENSHWAKIDKLQCRGLAGQGSNEEPHRLIRKSESGNASPSPDEPRLNPEDGR